MCLLCPLFPRVSTVRALFEAIGQLGPDVCRRPPVEMLLNLPLKAKNLVLLCVSAPKSHRHRSGTSAVQEVLCQRRGTLPCVRDPDAGWTRKSLRGMCVG